MMVGHVEELKSRHTFSVPYHQCQRLQDLVFPAFPSPKQRLPSCLSHGLCPQSQGSGQPGEQWSTVFTGEFTAKTFQDMGFQFSNPNPTLPFPVNALEELNKLEQCESERCLSPDCGKESHNSSFLMVLGFHYN